jgi:TorA maturation chaperone TorD
MTPADGTIEQASGRSLLYSILARAFKYPTAASVCNVRTMLDASAGGASLTPLDLNPTFRQTLEAMRTELQHWSHPEQRSALEAEYNRLFAHLGSAQCPPYECEYGYENVFQKAQAMADIAGFYAAYGLEPASTETDRVDFLSTELEFMAYLALHEAHARAQHEISHLEICRDSQRKFLCDHLGRWAPLFAEILSRTTSHAYYLLGARLLDAFLAEEVRMLDVAPVKVTSPNPSHLSAAQALDCAACTPPAFDEVKSSGSDADR